MTVLNALIPMGVPMLKAGGGDLSGFPELMIVMHTLAAAGSGTGHLQLFQATTAWLDLWSVRRPCLIVFESEMGIGPKSADALFKSL